MDSCFDARVEILLRVDVSPESEANIVARLHHKFGTEPKRNSSNFMFHVSSGNKQGYCCSMYHRIILSVF